MEEAQVNVNLPVLRAVEWPHCGAGIATAGLGCAGEEHKLGRGIGLAPASELIGPISLDAIDEAHRAAVRTSISISARPALLLYASARAGATWCHRWRRGRSS